MRCLTSEKAARKQTEGVKNGSIPHLHAKMEREKNEFFSYVQIKGLLAA